ncbi:MAG TPA: hypothetical protein VGE02_08340 [Gemmatimonadales bacterium]
MTNGHRNAGLARLGAISLFGGAGAVLLVWLLFFWVSTTNILSGLDDVHSFLTRITTLVPAVIIIAAHVALARQLLGAARHRP